MHPNAMNRNGKKRKRKKRRDEEAAVHGASPSSSFDCRVFPILLAAAARQSNSTYFDTLAARLLRRVLSRLSQPLSPLPDSLIALLPLILSSSCYSVAALSCEVLGAAALKSMEAGGRLASDSGIAIGLARALGSSNLGVSEAACNAVMDLSASSVGRERLAGSPVLLRILWNLFMESSIAKGQFSGRAAKGNKIMYLIIDILVLMVNSCKIDNLPGLNQELVRNVLP